MINLAACIQGDNKTSAEETINAVRNAGFKDVFVQYYHRQNLDFDELQQIDYCRKLGLNIIFCHLGYKDIDKIWSDGEEGEEVKQKYIEDLKLMKEKQIHMVVMHLVRHREEYMQNEIGLERIRQIVEYAKETGIKIAFENTKRQGYLEYILENIKDENVGVCFDAGHYHTHFDEKFDFKLFKDRYFAVHLHDNDKTGDLHLLPFDGTVEWQGVLSKLRENGYRGPLTLELCYREPYLHQSVEEFYKEGYKRGLQLEKIYENKGNEMKNRADAQNRDDDER